MKTKILTGLAALSLLVGVVSTQGCYDVGYPGAAGERRRILDLRRRTFLLRSGFRRPSVRLRLLADLVTTDLIAADLVMMVMNSPADTAYSTAVPDTLTVDTQWRIRRTAEANRSHRG